MFESIWTKKEVVDKDNQEVRYKIAAEEATCIEFPILSMERFGVFGIWFKDEQDYYLVNPLELVNSIYDDNDYLMLDFYDDSKVIPDGYFVVEVEKWNHCYSWRITHTNSQRMRQMQFTYKDYIDKIRNCIEDLNGAMVAGKPIAYKDNDVDMEGIQLCKLQLEVPGTTPSHYQLTTNSVNLESFVFNAISNEHYEIGIGNRLYKTWLTHWDNNMECIRHQLENYVYERKAKIELSFDTSDTVLRLSHQSILNRIEDCGEGYSYKYKEYVLVEIVPNDFAHMPVIKGFCEEKETIRTIYEGLLLMATMHPIDGDENPNDDLPSKIVAYNRYKSPIIESFLKGDERIPNTYMTRQIHIDKTLTIEPDYDCYIWDDEGCGMEVKDVNNKDGNPINMEEFDKWASEMKDIIIASETGQPYEKDWKDYHRWGITLAHKLRERLPASKDLWYAPPYEDKSGTIKHPILII